VTVRPKYTAVQIYRRMLAEARALWPHVTLVVLLNMLAAPLKLLLPIPLKIAVDNALGTKPLDSFWSSIAKPLGLNEPPNALQFACVLLVVFTVAAYLNGLAIWLLTTYTRERLLLQFRSKLLTHLQELPLTYHDSKGVSDSTYRIQHDAQAIEWVVLDGVQPFVTSTVTIIAMLYVTAIMDWQIALVAFVMVPVLFTLVQIWGGWLRNQWMHAKQFQSSAMSVIQESLGGLRLVKAFGTEDREQARFVEQASAGMRGELRVAFTQGTFDLATGTVLGLGTAIVLYVGIRHVQTGLITLGDFLLIWAYLAQLFGPLQLMGNKLSNLQGALASAERTLTVLDEVPKVAESPNAKPLARAAGHFVFDNVGFSYNESEPFIRNVCFEIPAGRCVGVVGMTGSGKTTLAAMLMRFYDPTSGRVLLDGNDLRDYRLDDLRQQFSVVLQDPILFSTTIAENIAYGRPSATKAEIIAAAEAANAHLFIQTAEEGYDSQVGDRGMMLSGGERQRIALARAFLRDAPLLILDEPTSAVDLKTESLICDALERLIQGRTTFLITHRPSLLRLCHTVWGVDNGTLSKRDFPNPAPLVDVAQTSTPSNV
jgi:ATP-binding cassette subfamily B protein